MIVVSEIEIEIEFDDSGAAVGEIEIEFDDAGGEAVGEIEIELDDGGSAVSELKFNSKMMLGQQKAN